MEATNEFKLGNMQPGQEALKRGFSVSLTERKRLFTTLLWVKFEYIQILKILNILKIWSELDQFYE